MVKAAFVHYCDVRSQNSQGKYYSWAVRRPSSYCALIDPKVQHQELPHNKHLITFFHVPLKNV